MTSAGCDAVEHAHLDTLFLCFCDMTVKVRIPAGHQGQGTGVMRELNEGTIWKNLDRMKRNWQGKVKDRRASNKKAFPILRPGETKGIAAVRAQQEVLPFVATNNPQSSGESPENNQLCLPTLQSPDSTSPWPNSGSQRISPQRSAFRPLSRMQTGRKSCWRGKWRISSTYFLLTLLLLLWSFFLRLLFYLLFLCSLLKYLCFPGLGLGTACLLMKNIHNYAGNKGITNLLPILFYFFFSNLSFCPSL